MPSYVERSECRVCRSANLRSLVSLGDQFVVSFPESERDESGLKAPLELMLCGNVDCSLVQLRHTLARDLLYREYWYKSGVNQTMRDALADITQSVQSRVSLNAGDVVLDIGANDGTLLRSYAVPGLFTVGFEPARNLVSEAANGTSLIVNDYFSADGFRDRTSRESVKVITTVAMFYDLDDPNHFVRDIRELLAADGLWVNQMNYLATMLAHTAFDNISHEHLEYYSVSSLDHLLLRHGLRVFDIELNDLNGGSFRAYIGRSDNRKVEPIVAELKDTEAALRTTAPYEAFRTRLETLKRTTMDFITAEKAAGKKIYAYGASTRGNTLLQYFGIDSHLVSAVADRNPTKWGRRMIGTNIPIVSEEEARRAMPDYFLILPWAFVSEFLARERAFLKSGGRFIVPLPDFRVLSQDDA